MSVTRDKAVGDGGLLLFGEPDDALGLYELASRNVRDNRTHTRLEFVSPVLMAYFSREPCEAMGPSK